MPRRRLRPQGERLNYEPPLTPEGGMRASIRTVPEVDDRDEQAGIGALQVQRRGKDGMRGCGVRCGRRVRLIGCGSGCGVRSAARVPGLLPRSTPTHSQATDCSDETGLALYARRDDEVLGVVGKQDDRSDGEAERGQGRRAVRPGDGGIHLELEGLQFAIVKAGELARVEDGGRRGR